MIIVFLMSGFVMGIMIVGTISDIRNAIVIFAHVMISRTFFLRTFQFVLTVWTIWTVIASVKKMRKDVKIDVIFMQM